MTFIVAIVKLCAHCGEKGYAVAVMTRKDEEK